MSESQKVLEISKKPENVRKMTNEEKKFLKKFVYAMGRMQRDTDAVKENETHDDSSETSIEISDAENFHPFQNKMMEEQLMRETMILNLLTTEK